MSEIPPSQPDNGTGCPPHLLLAPLLALSAARHSHLCPRQVLGVRLGLCGLRSLGLIPADYSTPFQNSAKRLLVISETDGCGADGIAVATDCAVGRRTLRVADFGKMAATLVDTVSGRAVRVVPQTDVRQRVWPYAPQARSRWHAYRQAYQVMPDEELLALYPVRLLRPVAELISRPDIRVNCQRCGEEIINQRQLLIEGATLCRACAGESYYCDEAAGAR